jgi:Ca2+:H+ antiporter
MGDDCWHICHQHSVRYFQYISSDAVLIFVIGGAHLLLVLPSLLVVALALTAILTTVIIFDGRSTWLEGLTLIGLYAIIAAAFWWG